MYKELISKYNNIKITFKDNYLLIYLENKPMKISLTEDINSIDIKLNILSDICKFKNREIKAKNIFYIKELGKNEAYLFVKKFHYLKEAKFFSIYNYGLFHKTTNTLLGVSTFSNPQGISALKGWFNLDNSCEDVLELSRLCMLPLLNNSNATSYLLGNSIKLLHREHNVRAVITLADSSRHVGSIYQVCNFKYYGLTDSKTDFFRYDGKKNPRGSTKEVRGVWLPRTQKHRYAYIMDETLKCNYSSYDYPNKEFIDESSFCLYCKDSKKVFDSRFNEYFNCPYCDNK